jgi:hypothetical protein
MDVHPKLKFFTSFLLEKTGELEAQIAELEKENVAFVLAVRQVGPFTSKVGVLQELLNAIDCQKIHSSPRKDQNGVTRSKIPLSRCP